MKTRVADRPGGNDHEARDHDRGGQRVTTPKDQPYRRQWHEKDHVRPDEDCGAHEEPGSAGARPSTRRRGAAVDCQL